MAVSAVLVAVAALFLALPVSGRRVNNSIQVTSAPGRLPTRYGITTSINGLGTSALYTGAVDHGEVVWLSTRVTDSPRVNISGIHLDTKPLRGVPAYAAYNFTLDIGMLCECTGYTDPAPFTDNTICPRDAAAGDPCPDLDVVRRPLVSVSVPAHPGGVVTQEATIEWRYSNSEYFSFGNPYDLSAKREFYIMAASYDDGFDVRASHVSYVLFFGSDYSCFVSLGATLAPIMLRPDRDEVPDNHCLEQFDRAGKTVEELTNTPWENLRSKRCVQTSEGDPPTGTCRKYIAGRERGLAQVELGQCLPQCSLDRQTQPPADDRPVEAPLEVQIVATSAIGLTACCICLCLVLCIKATREGRLGFIRRGYSRRRRAPMGDLKDPENIDTINRVLHGVPRRTNDIVPESFSCCVCLETPEETRASHDAAVEAEQNPPAATTEPVDEESGNAATPEVPELKSWADMPCGHTIHFECLSEWLLNRLWRGLPLTCPVCRALVCPAAEGVHEARAKELRIPQDPPEGADRAPDAGRNGGAAADADASPAEAEEVGNPPPGVETEEGSVEDEGVHVPVGDAEQGEMRESHTPEDGVLQMPPGAEPPV